MVGRCGRRTYCRRVAIDTGCGRAYALSEKEGSVSSSRARGFAFIAAALAVSIAALLLVGTVRSTPDAIAGPCADPPDLYRSDDDPNEVDPIDEAQLFQLSGTTIEREFRVIAYPNVPPPSKPQPYLQIEITPVGSEPDITVSWDPETAGMGFFTTLTAQIAAGAEQGPHYFTIKITCHPTDPVIRTIPVAIWVDTCPPPPDTDSPTPTKTPFVTGNPNFAAQPQGESCTITTPTPVVTPSPTPATTSPSPTPSLRPNQSYQHWGDVDCAPNDTDLTDALEMLKYLDSLPTPSPTPTATPSPTPTSSPSPTPRKVCFFFGATEEIFEYFDNLPQGDALRTVQEGDFNCSGGAPDALDALAIVAYVAGSPMEPPANCPQIGQWVIVSTTS
jgi:hypothetical protein